ncbi:MAG: hypothetical protein KBT03_04185, partial [Bacteroidales bacterium]|nr:hypothetical protein [Candidatus Scybalousia scybalohippi]
MNKDKIAYDELLKGIQNYVQKCVNDSGKDMTYTAVIKSVDSEGYTILLNGATYSGVKTIGGLCSANEVVNVLIPNGNYNNMIILKSGDSQGGGGISGDYLPLTGGVLTGDLTIGANLYVDGNVNFGENNEINGSYSVANGNGNTINGNYSHIEGLFNTSYEDGSHTEGYSTTNLSRFSHIEGYKGLLAESATGAHLEGYSEWSFEDMLTSSSKVETTVTSTSPYSFENVTLTNGISDSSYNSYYSSDSSVGWIVEYIDNEGEHNYAVVSRVNPVSNNCYLVPLKGHIYSMYAGDSVTIYKKMWTPYLFGYGDASHTEGYGNILMGAGCHAEGGYNILDTQGYSSYSHIEGYQNYGDYTYHSHIEGSYNTAKGKYEYNSLYNVHMEGGNNKATESYTHTEGYNNTASGYTGHVEGYGTKVLSSYGHAEGQYTVVGQSGYSGHAEGNYSQVNCSNGHAEGGYTEVTINGYCAHAEGANTKANNSNAHAEGYQTEANGYCSHSEGSFSKANNSNTHAEGYQTEANGYCSHSEGNYSVAHGEASHAEGYGIMALDYAHGEGYTTKAIGKYSHSENYLSMALGMSSHASGEQTVASGIQSFVQGYGSGTIADNNFVFVENTGNALKFEIQQPLESNELKGYVLTTVWQGNLLYLFNIEQSGNSYEIIDNYLY